MEAIIHSCLATITKKSYRFFAILVLNLTRNSRSAGKERCLVV